MKQLGNEDGLLCTQIAEQPLLSLESESQTGARYCRAHIGLVAKRHAAYYVWNILTIQFLIGVSTFSIFVIDPDEIADRLELLITLILASTAFKLVTTSMLPETPYITTIDVFNYAVLIQQGVTLIAICIMVKTDVNTKANDDNVAIVLVTCFLFFLAVFSAIYVSKSRKRERVLTAVQNKFDRHLNKDAGNLAPTTPTSTWSATAPALTSLSRNTDAVAVAVVTTAV